jgi:uncharacterized protein YfaQ (DUF2300 family)
VAAKKSKPQQFAALKRKGVPAKVAAKITGHTPKASSKR